MQKSHDIIIVGAGPIGLTAALVLAHQGFKVVILEKNAQEAIFANKYANRTFAYSYGTKVILEKYHLWKDLANYAEPITDIIVRINETKGFMHYDSNNDQSNGKAMGYNIETYYFLKAILAHLKKHKNVTIIDNVKIIDIKVSPGCVAINYNENLSLSAYLLVAADGKNSLIRQNFGIKSKSIPYQQNAIVYNIEHKKNLNNHAYEFFLESGPLALLPMQNQRANIIWSMDCKMFQKYQSLTNEEFAKKTEEYFAEITGNIKILGKRYSFPLDLTVVENFVKPRLALIGDSAHSLHPVAGQGFNLGIRDIEILSQHLAKAKDLGIDIGGMTILRQYETERRIDVMSMTAICDVLVRSLSKNSKLRSILGLGMYGLNKFDGIKNILKRRAMGL